MTSQAAPSRSNVIGDRDIQGLFRDGSPFCLAFQPQVDLRSGRVVSAEALARWPHPMLGNIAPAAFLPAIHRLGMQHSLFKRVCALALDALRNLEIADVRIPIAINACARALANPLNLEFLRDEASLCGVALSSLRIELTEDVPLDDQPGARVALAQLRAWGCEVSLNHFGAGHANLDQLIGLDIDEVKLDHQLVAHVNESHAALESVRFALALGRQMGWRVVAAGISTEAELRALRTLGCTHGQGFLLGRPMPLPQLIQVMETSSAIVEPSASLQSSRCGLARASAHRQLPPLW